MADEDLRNEIETGGATQEEDAGELKQALIQEKQKAETYLANWQRAQADYINYKRRGEQEKQEVSQLANSSLILKLLPVLDDLERAFTAIPPEMARTSWVDGIRLIDRKVRTTLETQGLSLIEAVGEPFDPRLHEAVREDNGQEGIILAEVQKGYRFRDQILRPSKVVVGNGEKDKAEHDRGKAWS